jgi:hypothetical protein
MLSTPICAPSLSHALLWLRSLVYDHITSHHITCTTPQSRIHLICVDSLPSTPYLPFPSLPCPSTISSPPATTVIPVTLPSHSFNVHFLRLVDRERARARESESERERERERARAREAREKQNPAPNLSMNTSLRVESKSRKGEASERRKYEAEGQIQFHFLAVSKTTI